MTKIIDLNIKEKIYKSKNSQLSILNKMTIYDTQLQFYKEPKPCTPISEA